MNRKLKPGKGLVLDPRYIKGLIPNLGFKMVIDGCDGTGKSVFANMVADMFGATIYHQTAETINNKNYYLTKLKELGSVVLDRSFFGDAVYNRPRKLTETDKGALIDTLNRENSIIIFFTCSPQTARKRVEDRGETFNEELFILQERLFLEQYARWKVKPFVIDTDNLATPEVMELMSGDEEKLT